jgi:hypothetical protein
MPVIFICELKCSIYTLSCIPIATTLNHPLVVVASVGINSFSSFLRLHFYASPPSTSCIKHPLFISFSEIMSWLEIAAVLPITSVCNKTVDDEMTMLVYGLSFPSQWSTEMLQLECSLMALLNIVAALPVKMNLSIHWVLLRYVWPGNALPRPHGGRQMFLCGTEGYIFPVDI